MPYRQPLAPWITFVADPVDLPLRAPGEDGLARVLSAQVVEHDADGLVLSAVMSDGVPQYLEIRAAGEGVIRVRLGRSPDACTRSAAAIRLVEPGSFPDARVEVTESGALLDAGSVRAHISFEPWGMSFRDPAGRVLTQQSAKVSDISYRMRILPFGRSFGADGETLAYHEAFAARPDEHFVGLGEKFTSLDKRGQRIVSWNYDAFSSESERSYKNVPFYLSSRGYGVLVDSGLATEFDICHSTHSCLQIAVPDDVLDYYVIAGPEPAQVLARYHLLTGRPATPPRWALGAWISTGYVRIDQEQTIAQARRIREHGIPCDVLHLDAFWQNPDHWCDMRWDGENFPDPRGMLETLHGLGFRVCVWMNPYISTSSPVFDKAAEAGYFLKQRDGSVYLADVWHGWRPKCGIVDFTDPGAVRWFQEDLLKPLLDQGVDIFKTDFGEGVPVDAVAADGMAGDALHNVYSLLFNDAVADITERVAGHRVVWARASFTGGQRHCGQWAGDNNATYTAMASTLRGGLSYAFSGVPYWSHDVGGFTGTPTPDLMARSAQFGALSPMMRFHGTTSRFPWDFEEPVERAVVDAVRLRYRLMPYLYSAAVEARHTGYPIMRPLAVHAPDEPAAWAADLEYLLGPDLLVAPMTDPDGERHVYLPAGEWIDFWTGQVYRGGGHIRVSKPLHQVPLFVRHGSLIATQPSDSVAEAGLIVECYGDLDAERVVHGETGDTRVNLSWSGTRAVLTSEGAQPIDAAVFPHVEGVRPPTAVMIDDRAATLSGEGRWCVG